MDHAIRFIEAPGSLRDPILIVAVRGAGANTTAAVADLFEQYAPQPLATIDPDEFFDFSVARPQARTVDGQRVIMWPDARFLRVALEERDLVLLSVVEPSLRWRRFASLIHEVAETLGIREAIVLSSFGGATPHTRPIPIHWVSGSVDTPRRFGIEPRLPRYRGPATFTMAVGALLRDTGMTVGTLNAIAPFYLGVDPNPYAVRALARALDREFGLSFDLHGVEQHIADVEDQAALQLESSEQLRLFQANLEEQFDEAIGASAEGSTGARERGDEPLPEAGQILADVEALLRRSDADAG
ncbi:MAG: PAC2 family protein [Chloroflexi bacterium]|nr:PAC2 family protein [Chloroflexota bacterium]